MSGVNDLPEKFVQFYHNLTPNQRTLYHTLLSDIESNISFMHYVEKWNKDKYDAYLDRMYKTVNYKMCLLREARRIEWLDIFSNTQKHVILDIGCGTGYFSYFAAKRGHTVYSLDAPLPVGRKIFLEGQKALGLSMSYHTITPYQPLPDLPQLCSLAVAFSPQFYRPETEDFWQEPTWRYFLKDLANHMIADGNIYFHLNMVASRPDFGPFGTAATKKLFLSLGTVENFICHMAASAVRKLE